MDNNNFKFCFESGCYETLCGTYVIRYYSFNSMGYSCWVAEPSQNSPRKYRKKYSGYLLMEAMVKLEKAHPELFTSLWKSLHSDG